MKTTKISEHITFTVVAFWYCGDEHCRRPAHVERFCGRPTEQGKNRHSYRTSSLGTNTSFGPLKQIDAGVLNVGYAEAGPADGPPVILLHGWPYDIYSYVDVAPLLASAGYRVIVPYLRGYGTTRFLSGETFRNGQPSAVAVDIIALMDALKIEKATLAGFDGAPGPPTSSRRCGRIAARPWSPSAVYLIRQPGIRQDAATAKG